MFYSRPKIEPLGWDLVAMPTPDGPKHHDGVTSDGRPVDFWFSGGWLTVSRGRVNAPKDTPDMEEIFSLPIAPFGTMDIEPEQLCDMCGVTVKGQKIDSAGMHTGARGFDWSGRTTYWLSTHLMHDTDDPRVLVNKLLRAFPGSILVQPEWGSHGLLRCRRVKFLLKSDQIVTLGIHWERSRMERLVSDEPVSTEDYERVFDYSITISRDDDILNDNTGARFVHQNGGKDLKYDVMHHRRYRISTAYRTSDPVARERTAKLVSLIDGYFLRGLKMVNLETGAVILENMPDQYDQTSYSRELRDRCLERENKYLFVGRTLPGDPRTSGEALFYGARPTVID